MTQVMTKYNETDKLRTTHNPLPQQQRSQSVDTLAILITDIMDVVSSVRHVQWNMHAMAYSRDTFDPAIGALQKQADLLAERVIALGGFVPATAKLIAHYSTIEAFPEHPQGREAFQKSLILRFEQLAKSAHEALNKSDNINDPVTSYHLTQTAAVIEQQLSVFENAFAPAA